MRTHAHYPCRICGAVLKCRTLLALINLGWLAVIFEGAKQRRLVAICPDCQWIDQRVKS